MTFIEQIKDLVGSERNERGGNDLGVNPNNIPINISLIENFQLATDPVRYDLKVENIAIISNLNESFRAYDKMDVSHVTAEPQSTSDFYSRSDINISEFYGEYGSEILFHTGPEWPICTYYDPTVPFLKKHSTLASLSSETDHTIELSFIQNGKFRIYPNPTSGNATIDLYDPSLQKIRIEVLNVYGGIISSFIISDGQILDLTNLAKGIYFLKANINNSKTINKLIIN